MTARRAPLLVIGGCVLWLILVVVFWVARPLYDTVPIGKDAGRNVVTQTVKCNGVLAGSAVDPAAVPSLAAGYAYTRPPCEEAQQQNRQLLLVNLVVLAVIAGVAGYALSRQRASGSPTATEPGDTEELRS